MAVASPPRPACALYLEGAAEPFACHPGDTVLEAMERLAGPGRAMIGRKRIPVGCRRGGCGVCRVQVLSGAYHTGPTSRAHVAADEAAAGYALACRLYPDGDLELRPALKATAAALTAPAGQQPQNQPTTNANPPKY